MCGETLVNNGINEKFEIKGWSPLFKKRPNFDSSSLRFPVIIRC